MSDMVNHPGHYMMQDKNGKPLEVIQLTSRLSFVAGNIFKYILRAPYKGNRIQDLNKALWYLRYEKQHVTQKFIPEETVKLIQAFAEALRADDELQLSSALYQLGTWMWGDDFGAQNVEAAEALIKLNIKEAEDVLKGMKDDGN